MGFGTNPRLEISEESYFHLVLMVLMFEGGRRSSCLIADNLPNDPRDRSLQECSLTFAEEVINTSLFC